MPRTRRIALQGRTHLVVTRGNAGGRLFFDDGDYERYLNHLRDLVREDALLLYAWALTPTELRLLMVPQRMALSRIMQRLHTRHTRTTNLRLQRTGHLFEGRYRSTMMPEQHVAEVVRYIHLWPVRSGRVRRADTYPWSSHRTYVARGDEWGDIVTAWPVLQGFGDTVPVAQRAFARFTEAAVLEADELPVPLAITGVAGDSRFAEDVLAEAGVSWRGKRRPAMTTLAKRVSLLTNVSLEDLTSSSRHQDLVLARRLFATSAVRYADRTVSEVAEFLRRDKSQVSRLVSQGRWQARQDEAFFSLYEQMKQARNRDDEA
jgi:putative transposase